MTVLDGMLPVTVVFLPFKFTGPRGFLRRSGGVMAWVSIAI